MKVELNPKFQYALEQMGNTNKSLFITGRAGTGKSTLLSYFRGTVKKRVAVLAPTGVAALNVEGQTIHSFFKFKSDVTVESVKEQPLRATNLYNKVEAIIIDEVSMVRADLLDCVDTFLCRQRQNDSPFGGVQMIFIGDLYQLPPVVTRQEMGVFTHQVYDSPYFFSSKSFKNFKLELIELDKIYRQTDEKFIETLNKVRVNAMTMSDFAYLNTRCVPDNGDGKITLTTTKAAAEEVNMSHLKAIPEKPTILEGEVSGDFGKEYWPTAINLQIKKGAQIMLLNNDRENRWVNGSLAKVKEIKKSGIIITLVGQTEELEVTINRWEISYLYVAEDGALKSRVIGSFTQYPLMLAWAITIHKSQGKTFDNLIVDVGAGTFAAGQTYVALSRGRTLEGITLRKPISQKHIRAPYLITNFINGLKKEQNYNG